MGKREGRITHILQFQQSYEHALTEVSVHSARLALVSSLSIGGMFLLFYSFLFHRTLVMGSSPAADLFFIIYFSLIFYHIYFMYILLPLSISCLS